MSTLLTIIDVKKTFGGIVALDGVDITVKADEITGLIGPNGAGKTTLFNVVTGVLDPDEGTVQFRNRDITSLKSHEICHEGIGRTFQTPKPIRALTVEENLAVARTFGSGDVAETTDAPSVDDVLRLFSLGHKRAVPSDELQLVEQKFVDVARTLVTDPDLILLDEIMAGLNPTEKQDMISTMRTVHDDFDISFLVIEHDLQAIRSISDRIVAINEGTKLVSGSPGEVMANDDLREAYIGT